MKHFNSSFLILFSIVAAVSVFADDIDTAFNARIQTTTLLPRNVMQLVALPDGKMLAVGNFNRYNDHSVGNLIRLNADGSLDQTFNNDFFRVQNSNLAVMALPNGNILLIGNVATADGANYQNTVVQLNPDGSINPAITNTLTGVRRIQSDGHGRLLLFGGKFVVGEPSTDQAFFRIFEDGQWDSTFAFQSDPSQDYLLSTYQNDKIVISSFDLPLQQYRLTRLNQDGSVDSTFSSTLLGGESLVQIQAQPDGGLLVLSDYKLRRVNQNGGVDATFQNYQWPINLGNQARGIFVHVDGRVTLAHSLDSPYVMRVIRLLTNGVIDPTFTKFDYVGNQTNTAAWTRLSDDGIAIGDSGSGTAPNKFIRLLPDGLTDPLFNQGGSGFQTTRTGNIKAIRILPDQRILIAGDFDVVNDIPRAKIARLNPDSSLDSSFDLNSSGTGNSFSSISDVYQISPQTDGKILLSGNFSYTVNGAQKSSLVRIESSGSIDPTFNLSRQVQDFFVTSSLGTNKPVQMSNGKIVVATSRVISTDPMSLPLLLSSTGVQDLSFNSTVFNGKSPVAIFDVAPTSDGKILIAGRHEIGSINGEIRTGFVIKLNSNGTADENFQNTELNENEIFAIKVLSDGRIAMVSRSLTPPGPSKISILNPNGTIDPSFDSGSGTNGKINAIEILPNNKIAVGGLFSTYGGQSRRNFAIVGTDGILDSYSTGTNGEVLSVATDPSGRILLGGSFTSVLSGEVRMERSYIARLISSAIPLAVRSRSDFDGDGRTDVSFYRPSDGSWNLKRSSDGAVTVNWGNSTDIQTPGDFDGDGKTDIAVYRPSTGDWFILNSSNSSYTVTNWGNSTDKPVAADYDGDGKADIAVYRPSEGTWYIVKSSNGAGYSVNWGIDTDLPVPADYDGDGKTDTAVFRPSDGTWYVIKSTGGGYGTQWGAAEDKPVPADYDGDNKDDLAVFRPSDGTWYVYHSGDQQYDVVNWGAATDVPVPGDYDGDGRDDIAQFRPSTGDWFVLQSTSGFLVTNWGTTGDKPIPAAYIP